MYSKYLRDLPNKQMICSSLGPRRGSRRGRHIFTLLLTLDQIFRHPPPPPRPPRHAFLKIIILFYVSLNIVGHAGSSSQQQGTTSRRDTAFGLDVYVVPSCGN